MKENQINIPIEIIIIVAAVTIVLIYQMAKARQTLYRMLDLINEILRIQGVPEIDAMRTPKLRNLLSITQLTKRLEEKIKRLKEGSQP